MPDPVASSPAGPKLTAKDYVFTGQFDHGKLEASFLSELKGTPKFSATSLDNFLVMIDMMEKDKDVTDIRWMSYMLATSHWETAAITSSKVAALDKKGHTLKDKSGKPLMKTLRLWRSMKPIRETGSGKGRRYELPVKVAPLLDGSATVVEQDGDEFRVAISGSARLIARGDKADSKQGVLPTSAVSATYAKASGSELSYYGRGFVQLTWWENYASIGAAVGLGLGLLLEPDRALDPEIAYKVMSYGMRTGKGFANGRKFAAYMQGDVTDYVGARAMVNGSDHQNDIADIARKFETVLLAGKQR